MKKNLQLLLIAAFLPAILQAQITIQANQIQLIGNFGVQSRDLQPDSTILPGSTGEQTWDFTALHDDERDSLTFLEVSQTPYGSLFPAANIAADFNNDAFIYLEKSNDFLRTHGSYGTLNYSGFEVTAAYRFNPPQTLINFPMEMNNTSTEQVVSTIVVPGSALMQSVDSLRLVNRTTRTVTVDAFGSLTTPTGTYETLRTTELESSLDSVFALSNGVWFPAISGSVPDTIIFYNWWTNQNGLGFPVVQLEAKDDGTIDQAIWLNNFVSSVNDGKQLLEFSVSPNPASDFVNLALPESFNGKIEVYDLNGRLQFEATSVQPSQRIDIQSFMVGTYVLVLKDQQGRLAGFERFAVVR